MEREVFAGRLNRLRSLLDERHIDAFLVAVPENRYYLSGYGAGDLQLTESSGYLLITHSKQCLITDFRYQEEAENEAGGFQVLILDDGLSRVLSQLFSEFAVERVGVESHHLTFSKYREVEEALRKAQSAASLVPIEDLVEQIRMVKEPEEIDKIRSSLALTEKVLVGVWENLRPGRTEKEIAWEIERTIREAGAEAVSFPPIVAGGPNAALPHAVPTDRSIVTGDSVVLDVGARLGHYCSDMTRTWFAGVPGPKLQEIYRVVRDAQLAAMDFIRAGRDTAEVDGVARRLIAGEGYGDHFGHGLGHGVGLAVHEKPGLRKQKSMILQENMVVTIEPGIYLRGYGGVRLEEMVRITEKGCELLNRQSLYYDWR
ncbi:MAG TPA: Xaa-Pro peptidase family protein [Syntrophobacteraceae bacterium]|nr:Xaa-Pro peptidase family protein [Syntrophobacteraceae bacterium]